MAWARRAGRAESRCHVTRADKRPTSRRKRDRGRGIGQWKQAWDHDAKGLHFTHGG
jgi:hypothetical protein